jgi:bifunctional enzyme CysN/CysC
MENSKTKVPVRISVKDVRPASGKTVCEAVLLAGEPTAPSTVIVAESGQPVTLQSLVAEDAGLVVTLEGEVDVQVGDILCSPEDRPEVSDQFAALLEWSGKEPLLPGRRYTLRLADRVVQAAVTEIKYRLDEGDHLAAKTLNDGDTAFCNLSLAESIAFDGKDHFEQTSRFVLEGKKGEIVGRGRVEFGLRRATNVHWQALDLSKHDRSLLKKQNPCILWFTGLSGSGKSTVANLVERALHTEGRHTYLLDGDNVRHGLNRDLGFSDADRVENIRRVAEVSKLFIDSGMIVIVAFISPFRAERKLARDMVQQGEFLEVYVDTPIEECRRRDPKGLYARADRGEIKNFTGVDSPYEPPEQPEIHLETMSASLPDLAQRVIQELRTRGVIGDAPRTRRPPPEQIERVDH